MMTNDDAGREAIEEIIKQEALEALLCLRDQRERLGPMFVYEATNATVDQRERLLAELDEFTE